jgi:hypothetical protein
MLNNQPIVVSLNILIVLTECKKSSKNFTQRCQTQWQQQKQQAASQIKGWRGWEPQQRIDENRSNLKTRISN